MTDKKLVKLLDVHSFSKVLSIFCGFYLFLTAFFPAIGFDFLWWNNRSLTILGAFYPGMAPTFFGVILAFIWGTVSGALFGLIISWLYTKQ